MPAYRIALAGGAVAAGLGAAWVTIGGVAAAAVAAIVLAAANGYSKAYSP